MENTELRELKKKMKRMSIEMRDVELKAKVGRQTVFNFFNGLVTLRTETKIVNAIDELLNEQQQIAVENKKKVEQFTKM